MGDDGIGWRLFEHLRVHGGLPEGWDLRFAGTDLLAAAGEMERRQCVLLADAMESPMAAGTVEIIEANGFAGGPVSAGSHQLAAVEALRLIQLTSDGVRGVRFLLFGVAVDLVRCGEQLSPALEDRFPEIVGALMTLTQAMTQVAAGGLRRKPGMNP